MARLDFVGQRFGRLVVTKFAGVRPGRHSTFHCQCDCGRTKVVHSTNLKRGLTRSCGCWHIETVTQNGYATKVHGEAKSNPKNGLHPPTPEYLAWLGMKARCRHPNPNAAYSRNYGGRGIRVCQRWLESYENFLADMGRKPSPQHSLDRIDVDGNYEPKNCRWATPLQQRHNQRKP